MNRQELINAIEELRKQASYDDRDEIETILYNFGASEDDSDPDEGFYITMRTADLREVYDRIAALVRGSEDYQWLDAESELIRLGYSEKSVDSREGSVYYFTRGNIGIVLCSAEEAKSLAKSLL